VIEDPAERKTVLHDAWSLAKRCLVVSARLAWERKQVSGSSLGDGTLTSRNTFQHLFTPAELRQVIEETTGCRVIGPVPRVVHAFRGDHARIDYLASRAAPELAWHEGTDAQSALAAVVDFLERRGRMPMIEETPDSLLPLLRHLSGKQLTRLAQEEADPTS